MSVKVKDVLDALQQMQKSLECPICLELLKDPHSTKCNHQFCGQCIKQVLEKSSKKSKNKWYCPLCKTPVSKRSLTPNPKLSEIVAAVRSLQGAVQDDTGVPTGSSPSQPLNLPSTVNIPSVAPFSIPQPTSQKSAAGRRERQRASRRNQFTVYIDNNGHSDQAVENQPPQVVANVNVRPSLLPLSVTQIPTKAKKSTKVARTKTRKTRNSRRILEQKGLPENNNVPRDSNEDLLHLIDTMTFKPVPTEGLSKDFILDPCTNEPKPVENSAPRVNSSFPAETINTVKESTGGKDDSQNPPVQKEKTVCLTTIAEADSSVRTSHCESAGPFGNITSLNCENTANSKENIEAVSSSKFGHVTQSSSLDTMQSVSILQSLDFQPHDLSGNVCNETQIEDKKRNEDITCQDDDEEKGVANNRCDVENGEEMYDAAHGNACKQNTDPEHHLNEEVNCQGNNENKPISEAGEKVRDVIPEAVIKGDEENNLNPTNICEYIQDELVEICEPFDTALPSESVTNNIKDLAEQSLDFEGLVSLFDEPSSSNSQNAIHMEETVQNGTRLDKSTEQVQQAKNVNKDLDSSPSLETAQLVENENVISSVNTPIENKVTTSQKGCGHANKPANDYTDDSSDLCERVKQRQRKRTTQIPLTTAESPTTSITTQSKAKKRSAESVTDYKTREESSPGGSAKKKLKISEVHLPSQPSLKKKNTVGEKTWEDTGLSLKQKQKDKNVVTTCDVQFHSYQSEIANYSCSTDKSNDSNEMVPASVSSSENSKSAVINPMDVYANQTPEEKKVVARRRKRDARLQKVKEGQIFIEDHSQNLKIRQGNSQDEKENSCASQGKNAFDVDDESTVGSSLSQKLSISSQNKEDSTRRQRLSREVKTGNLAESLPFDTNDKALFSATDQGYQVKEDDDVEEERYTAVQIHSNGDSHRQRKTLRSSQCLRGKVSLKESESGDSEIASQAKGKYASQPAEDRSQEAHSSSTSPTQCSLEVDDLTPCLFGNDSCETPAKILSQKRITLRQEVVQENHAEVNEADVEEVRALDDNESPGVAGLLSVSRKVASLNTDSEETQSLGTSQSISVLYDLDVPSEEHEEGAACNDKPTEPFNAKHTDIETEIDNTWPEPLPKKPRAKQQPDSEGVEFHMSDCHDSKKPHGSELTESEIIPPTPPVKFVTKDVFDLHTQSPLKLSRSKTNLQRKDVCKVTCRSEVLTVKRKRSTKSPRCSNSPKLQDREDDRAGRHHGSFGCEVSEVSVSELENHDRNSVSAGAKSLTQATESESDTSKQKQVNSPRDANTETEVHESEIHLNKTPGGLKRSSKSRRQSNYVVNSSPQDLDGPRLSQGTTNSVVSQNGNRAQEDFKDSPSAEVESVDSSPCSRVDNVGDSFDWSGTRTLHKGNACSQNGPVPVTLNKGEHLRLRDVKDCNVEMLTSQNTSQACHETEGLLEDSSTKYETKRDLANPVVGNIRVGNSSGVVNEEICLKVTEEGDSSGDEALLKPVFLPKTPAKSHESQVDCKENSQDNVDEEEEGTVFSQELIPSENDDDDGISSSYKALDSTGASTSTFLSEATASTQRMEVLRQDVEAMEKEMEELRAYLAKTDENREEGENRIEEDDINCQDADLVDDADIQPSLSPPPPLTPKSIPPMPQLSTPLKDVSRYLNQEGQSSDESSDYEDAISSESVTDVNLQRSSCYQRDKNSTDKYCSAGVKSRGKRPLSPSYEDDGLSITTVEHRRQETPSPPRNNHSVEGSQEKDEDKLIVIDDRNGRGSRTGSLLLVKKRKLGHDFAPKKSPVVSLLFTRQRKGLEKSAQFSVTRSKRSSPTKKKSSSFIYSEKPGLTISPIRGQSPTRTVSREHISRDRSSKTSLSRDIVSHGGASSEQLSDEGSHSPNLVLTNVKEVTNNKNFDKERDNGIASRQLSFVATRLNRQQLAEARALAEMYGGKLASEFNSRTSHVIMTTDENMQVTRHSYTMKYLLGLALGKWIVSHRWIAACNQAKSLVSEVDYEVKGDAGLGQASTPRVARTARSCKEALLFQDYDVLCSGEFSAAVSKEQLSQLLKFCGARVFIDAESMKRVEKGRRRIVAIDKETHDNAKELKVVCRQLNTKPVSLQWVTDSIANYKVQDLKDYIIEL